MSFPLTPPPVSDVGAWTNPRTLQRWLDINPIGKLTRTQTYLTLPIFSIAITWQGYSDIVAVFNCEAPNNFSLIDDIVTGTIAAGASPASGGSGSGGISLSGSGIGV